jgi:hypothetical protein
MFITQETKQGQGYLILTYSALIHSANGCPSDQARTADLAPRHNVDSYAARA